MDKQVWADEELSVTELGSCFHTAQDQLMIARREYIHELRRKVATLEKREVEDQATRHRELAKREGREEDSIRFKSHICAKVRARWTLEEITAEMRASSADDDDRVID